MDLRTCELNVMLLYQQNDIAFDVNFAMRLCREKNGNSPDFFASNYDTDIKLKRAASCTHNTQSASATSA
jgi:hypothetical protein